MLLDAYTDAYQSIPLFNPIGMYGRVFFFSWFGFFIGTLTRNSGERLRADNKQLSGRGTHTHRY
jgi:hypothetical protein